MDLTAVLNKWYATHPAVRRLWAMEAANGIRVFVTLEPTPDGDDTLPVWFANGHAWASDLQSHTEREVQLELIVEAPIEGLDVAGDGVMIAALNWRDPTVPS